MGVEAVEVYRSGFVIAYASGGDSLWGRALPEYTDASAQPINLCYLTSVKGVRHPEGGYWIWTLNSTSRQGVAHPYVSARSLPPIP